MQNPEFPFKSSYNSYKVLSFSGLKHANYEILGSKMPTSSLKFFQVTRRELIKKLSKKKDIPKKENR